MTFPGQHPQPGQPPHGQAPYGQAPYGQAPYGQPPYPQPGAGRRRAPALPGPGWLLAGAGALGAIGAVLPWATLGAFSKSGIDGDGAITIVLALAVGAAGVWTALRAPLGIPITALVLAALITLIALVDISDVSSSIFGVGMGLWLTLGSGLAGIAGGIWALAARPGAKAGSAPS